jgi:glycosyltransferase involved in cell wall biosynthesis
MKRAEMLSVVVPVFKEEGNIPLFLDRITPILERTGLDFEIILREARRVP